MTKLFARSSLSTVVPAKAATHTPCASEFASPSNNGMPGEYGSPPSRRRRRRGLRTWFGNTLTAALLISLPPPAVAQSSVESFYKDKRVRMLVGYGVGTGNDLYLRLLARHIGKYIPGKPTMVPENMPGAGGIVMFNHLYNVAARDGTRDRPPLAQPGDRAALWQSTGALRRAEVRLARQHQPRCRDLHHLGQERRDVDRGRQAAARLRSARPAHRPRATIFPKLLNAVLGTRFKTVLGYPDSAAVGIAMERGELDGYCSFTWAAIKSARPNWLTNKQINVILQLSMAKHPELPDVPLVADLARDEASRQIFTLAFGAQKMGRPVATTPGVPPERLAALRQAFDATMRDPELPGRRQAQRPRGRRPDHRRRRRRHAARHLRDAEGQSCSATRRSATSDRA